MRLNPFVFLLIGAFVGIVQLTNHELKKNKKYEKTTNDSSVVLNDSTIFVR